MRSTASLVVLAALLSACLGEATNAFFDDHDASIDGTQDAYADADARIDAATDVAADPAADPFVDTTPATDLLDDPEAALDSTGDDVADDADRGFDVEAEPDADAGPPAAFSFAVFGDNQFAVTSCTSGIPERLAVPEVVLDLDPTFLVHTGDLMDHGYEDGAYAHLVDCYDEMLATVPFFPTGGNHDFGSGGITRYKAYLEEQLFDRNPVVYPGDYDADFTVFYEDDPIEWSTDRDDPSDRTLLPSGVTWKTYYAFQYQNAVFISFEQGTRWWTQTPKPWLEQHLSAAAADPTVDHIFVIMHHPMYSTTMDESSDGECVEPVRRQYEELFRQYDVTAVFSGHAHCYDRFYVPDDGSPTRQSPPPQTYAHDGTGVHYIVTGGGGGGLTNSCDPFPLKQEYSYSYSQARGCFHHVTTVEVDGGRLLVSIVRVEGGADDTVSTIVDSFTIE